MRFYRLITEERFKPVMKTMWIERGESIDNYENGVTGVFMADDMTYDIQEWRTWAMREEPVNLTVCLEIEIPKDKLHLVKPDPVANHLGNYEKDWLEGMDWVKWKANEERLTERLFDSLYEDLDTNDYDRLMLRNWVYEGRIPARWIKTVRWVKTYWVNNETSQVISNVEFETSLMWTRRDWTERWEITKTDEMCWEPEPEPEPAPRKSYNIMVIVDDESENMKTTQVCKHVVGSTDTSLGEVYGAGLRPEIDNKTFEETGRYRHFHGYRPCLSCGAIFHMGMDIVDADGSVLERNGFDTSQIPIPSQWKFDGISQRAVIFELEGFELTLAVDDWGQEPVFEWLGNTTGMTLVTDWLYLGCF